MDYIDRLKALREDNDLKQKDVANILNKSQQGYAHLENRKAKFTFEDIIKLAKYYNVSIDYIAGLSKNTTPQQKQINISGKINIKGNKNKINIE